MVVRATALQLVDLGLISLSGHTKRHSKIMSTAFLLGGHYQRDGQEEEATSYFFVLGKIASRGFSISVLQTGGKVEQSTSRGDPL